MSIKIRQEETKDHQIVFHLVESAFSTMKYSNHKEQFLVDSLRKSDAFIPELSLVAEKENQIVGFILLTKIHIENDQEQFDALALAPVAVHPDFQKQGIGGLLIREAHRIAKALNHERIVLIGHEAYYPRFGYEMISKYGIEMPFESPKENCMIIGLNQSSLDGVNGMVVYSKPFFE